MQTLAENRNGKGTNSIKGKVEKQTRESKIEGEISGEVKGKKFACHC